MKKTILFCISILVSHTLFCQSMTTLEKNHKFKNITIGMPINELKGSLQLIETKDGYDVYKSTDLSLYSIFNIKMDLVCIIAKANKVYAIEVSKIYKASEQPDKTTIFTSTELEILESGLTSQYGKASHYLKENNAKYFRTGSQWQSQSYTANCFIDFYGTLNGYKIYFSLSKLNMDF